MVPDELKLLTPGNDDDQPAQLDSGVEVILDNIPANSANLSEDVPHHRTTSSWTQTDPPTKCSAPSNFEEATKIIGDSTKVILSDLLITDKGLNVWTGIPTFDLLSEICLAVKKLEDSKISKQFKLHTTDRVILVLSKLKQNLSLDALGTLFNLISSNR